MDQKTFQKLEFDKVRAKLARYSSFSAGETLARQLSPTSDLFEARQWQTETAEAIQLLEEHSNITIGGARDVRRAVDNAEHGFVLPAEDLQAIAATITAARTIKRQILKLEEDFPQLADVAGLIEECSGIVSAVNRTIDDRGEVLDSASPKLAKIRQDQHKVHGRIQEKLQRLLNSSMSQYLQDPIVTQRNGRYVIPLRADAKGRLKGIVHDQSGSGATLWVEPMNTVEMNNEYRELHLQEREEIQRILRALSTLIAEQGGAIKRVVERMAELDLIFSRAQYALAIGGVRPQFTEWRTFPAAIPPKHANERKNWTPPPPNLHPGSTIWIKGARHPLLDAETVIPTNLTLDEETFIVLITGPNTGGKTVSLKTMGLMVLMAQSGLHLPATEARLTLFNNVFADIGDEQSIEQSLSTFSAHLTNITRVLDGVDERSLVLLDELGSGTDPSEGAALAQAITNYLRDKGTTTFIATHYPELKIYASQTDGLINASMLFDLETLSPTYVMSIGIPGRSNAFAIARRLGLSETILDEAMQLVGHGSQSANDVLDSIYSLREKMEAEEAGARLALRDAESARDRLRKRLKEIETERSQVLASAQEEAQEELDGIRKELRRVRRTIRGAASLNALKKVSKQVEQIEETQVQPIKPRMKVAGITPAQKKEKQLRRTLQVGDTVTVTTLNQKGVIIELSKKGALVAMGRLQIRTKLAELEFKGRGVEETAEETAVRLPATPSPDIELDIRGKRVEDGLIDMERYLDSAFLAQMPFVRIIHGKGTGKLRQAVRKSLTKNSYVRTWEEGQNGEGGAGVTVAKMVKE